MPRFVKSDELRRVGRRGSSSCPDRAHWCRVSRRGSVRFLVAALPRACPVLEGRPDSVLAVIRKLGSIQFDPIAVAGRSHDLMLHARVAGYEPAWCDALYEQRKVFETTNKALSFVPASEFPGTAWTRPQGPAVPCRGPGGQRGRRGAGARAPPGGWAALLGRLRARSGPDEGLVRDAGERRALGARGVHRRRRDRLARRDGERPLSTTSSSGCSRPSCSRRTCPSASSSGTSSSPATAPTACSAQAAAGGTFARIANPDVRRRLH